VLDEQIAGTATLLNEPAAPAAVVKIGWSADQVPADDWPTVGPSPIVRTTRTCAAAPPVNSMLGSLSVEDVRDGRLSPTASSSGSTTTPRHAIFVGGKNHKSLLGSC